jgi:uncharacterized phiE125 gp8 family phage protein
VTVTLTLAKLQARVTHSEEDVLLTQYIASAKAWVERYTGLMLEEAEVTDRFTEFGDYLKLSRGPFLELTGVTYTDADGDPQTITDARYQDGLLYAPTTGWPSIETYSTIEAIYTAGFDVYNPLPEELVQAQLLLISHWYDNRSAVLVGSISKELEYAIEALAGPFRLPTLA